MASNGPEWAEIFSRYNSGTYNNQWFVVDYKLFTIGQPLVPNTIYLLEQMIGYIHVGDITDYVALGYWPSYNIPFYRDIFYRSGFQICVQEYGPSVSYNLAPRANIFRRDQEKVQNISDMQSIMQYNDWENDPFSLNNPCNSISARCDIITNVTNPIGIAFPFGGADSKIVNYNMIKSLSCMAICGPTHETQPPFSWDAYPEYPHSGQPNVFDFNWININL